MRFCNFFVFIEEFKNHQQIKKKFTSSENFIAQIQKVGAQKMECMSFNMGFSLQDCEKNNQKWLTLSYN